MLLASSLSHLAAWHAAGTQPPPSSGGGVGRGAAGTPGPPLVVLDDLVGGLPAAHACIHRLLQVR